MKITLGIIQFPGIFCLDDKLTIVLKKTPNVCQHTSCEKSWQMAITYRNITQWDSSLLTECHTTKLPHDGGLMQHNSVARGISSMRSYVGEFSQAGVQSQSTRTVRIPSESVHQMSCLSLPVHLFRFW